MKVRFLKLMAGPGGCRHPGQVADLPEAVASALVACEAAVLVERAVVRPSETTLGEPAPETATVSAPEAAVRRGRKPPRA